MADEINSNFFGGRGASLDYLAPRNKGVIQCGPISISNATVTDLVVTGTVVLPVNTSGVPIVLNNPNNIWTSIGPTTVTASNTLVFDVPMHAGSWIAEISLVGTGATLSDLGHYQILSSLTSTGPIMPTATTTIILTSVTRSIENGSMSPDLIIPGNPTIVVDGLGANMTISITPVVTSVWAGYVKMVGSNVV